MLHAALLERHQLARLRLRRHASEDHHPSRRARRLRRSWRWRRCSPSPARDFLHALHPRRRSRVPHRQRGLSRALRRRLAHHRHRRRVRRGRRGAASCSASPSSRWSGRSASPRPSRRACARCSARCRKSFHPGRAAQNGLTAALLARAELHQLRRAHRGASAASRNVLSHRRANSDEITERARRALGKSRSTPTSRSPAASSSIPRSTAACSFATSTA